MIRAVIILRMPTSMIQRCRWLSTLERQSGQAARKILQLELMYTIFTHTLVSHVISTCVQTLELDRWANVDAANHEMVDRKQAPDLDIQVADKY